MTLIKELKKLISDKIEIESSLEKTIAYLEVQSKLKELAKKDLEKIEPLLKKGGNWNIVVSRAYKQDLEEVVK
jgi:hypothetical protein